MRNPPLPNHVVGAVIDELRQYPVLRDTAVSHVQSMNNERRETWKQIVERMRTSFGMSDLTEDRLWQAWYDKRYKYMKGKNTRKWKARIRKCFARPAPNQVNAAPAVTTPAPPATRSNLPQNNETSKSSMSGPQSATVVIVSATANSSESVPANRVMSRADQQVASIDFQTRNRYHGQKNRLWREIFRVLKKELKAATQNDQNPIGRPLHPDSLDQQSTTDSANSEQQAELTGDPYLRALCSEMLQRFEENGAADQIDEMIVDVIDKIGSSARSL